MTEPSYLSTTRTAYNTVATSYAQLVRSELAAKPLDRAMLAAFAELVRATDAGPVADVGCGPGRVTAHLHSFGLTVFGIDLSPEMVAVARQEYPDLRFEHAYGHEMSLDAYRLSPDSVAKLVIQAGLVVDAQLLREPDRNENVPQANLLARKPAL